MGQERLTRKRESTAAWIHRGCLPVVGLVALFMCTNAASSGQQAEFGKRSRYDATQCLDVIDEQVVQKKHKYLAVFSENRCSRPIYGLACFEVTRPSLKFSRTGWYCDVQEYKSRSRAKVSEHATYGRVKKWAACNLENEKCMKLLDSIEGNVKASGQDPEAVARRLR